MPEQNSKKFLREQESRQKQLVALKKMQQGVVPVPEYTPADTSPKTPADKWHNFWYYYKYYVLATVVLAIVIAVCVSQCVNRTKYDYTVLLHGYTEIYESQSDVIAQNLAAYGEDVNGDGKTNVLIINCSADDKTDYNQRTAKSARLQANLTDENVILFLTDDEGFEYFEKELKGGLFVDKGLPEKDGKAITIDNSFITKNKDKVVMPDNLKLNLSVRVTKGTVIEKKKSTKENVENAEKLLYNIAARQK